MSVAKIYMDGVGNVCFQLESLHLEFIASAILTKIKSVLEYDNTGYVVIDTNYGEEFYDLAESITELNIENKVNISKIMAGISKWEVIAVSKNETNSIRDDAIMIINNIAFGFAQTGDKKMLRAIDINNTKYKADFMFDVSIKRFRQINSSFADGKRKYEMLYLLERNTEELWEAYQNA